MWRTWESKTNHKAYNKTTQRLCQSNQISMLPPASANAANSPATCLRCWVFEWFQPKTFFASTKTVWNMLHKAWLFASGSLELGATLFPNFLQKICRNFGENCCALCGPPVLILHIITHPDSIHCIPAMNSRMARSWSARRKGQTWGPTPKSSQAWILFSFSAP